MACYKQVFTKHATYTERNKFKSKFKRLKNPNWWEADQLAIYKHDQGVELGSTWKQPLQLSDQSGT